MYDNSYYQVLPETLPSFGEFKYFMVTGLFHIYIGEAKGMLILNSLN